DDGTRRRATIGLALELSGLSPVDGAARARLSSAAPLVHEMLILVEDGDRPLLGRSLRVPDRVTSHLLGIDVAEPDLLEVLEPVAPVIEATRSASLERALRSGIWPVHLRESGMASGVATATASVVAL